MALAILADAKSDFGKTLGLQLTIYISWLMFNPMWVFLSVTEQKQGKERHVYVCYLYDSSIPTKYTTCFKKMGLVSKLQLPEYAEMNPCAN